jgi:hypothetical protein
VFSATLFASGGALSPRAGRVRDRGALLAAMIAVVALVYLPTSFFIIGEYNVAYAAVTAAVAVALTRRDRRRDGALMLALGLLCIASYEAMLYLGPSPPRSILWSRAARRDRCAMRRGARLPRRGARRGEHTVAILEPRPFRARAGRRLRLLAEPAVRRAAGGVGGDRSWRWSFRPGSPVAAR